MATLHLTTEFMSTGLICPPDKKRIELCDLLVPGLLIECRSGSGAVPTWYWRRKVDGKTAYKHLGTVKDLDLDEARRQVLMLKSESAIRIVKLGKTATEEPPTIVASSPATDDAMTLDAFMTDLYFPHVKMHKRSWKRDDQLYRLRIKAKFGHLPLSNITRKAVNQFKIALLAEKLSNASVNHHVQLLRHVCNLAVSWEVLKHNVLKGIELLDLDNQVENYLDDAAEMRFVQVMKSDANRNVCLILLFLLSTGARLGEVLRAEWKQVDVDAGSWRIPATNTKAKRVKALPLNSSALWVVEQLQSKGESPYLFPSPATGRPYTTITRAWYRVRKKAQIPDNVRIHDLRHTFASRIVSRGKSLFIAQKLLGHADPRTTMRYAHLEMGAMQEAANVAALRMA